MNASHQTAHTHTTRLDVDVTTATTTVTIIMTVTTARTIIVVTAVVAQTMTVTVTEATAAAAATGGAPPRWHTRTTAASASVPSCARVVGAVDARAASLVVGVVVVLVREQC
jgi:hypothetical protein